MRQFPCVAVGRGVNLNCLGGENPVVGIMEEAHGDSLDRSVGTQVKIDVYVFAPVTLPVAIGIGVVTAQHPIGQSVVATSAIFGIIVAVTAVEFAYLAYGLMEQEVLVTVYGFIPLAIGNGTHNATASNGEGTFVEVGTLRGLAAIDGKVYGAVLENGAQRDKHLTFAILVGQR